MKVAFNTGAPYTEHGQRIAAWTEHLTGSDELVVCFVDFDRGIYEFFPYRETAQIERADEFARHVMYMYNFGQYGMRYQTGMREVFQAVYCNGFDAFRADPEVQTINYKG